MRQIELPAKFELISVRVKKIARGKAVVKILDSEVEFSLPAEILPEDVEVGEKLGIKILDAVQTNESHNDFARKLLEEIIN